MSGEHHDDEVLTQTTAEEPVESTAKPVAPATESVETVTATVEPPQPVGYGVTSRQP